MQSRTRLTIFDMSRSRSFTGATGTKQDLFWNEISEYTISLCVQAKSIRRMCVQHCG